MRNVACGILVLLSLMTVSAQAIVIRHDRPDSLYRQLAQDYPMACRVGPGNGTLIDPHWVLTAAHVADALPRKGATVHVGGQDVAVAEIAIHPNYAVAGKHRDLALLRLADPVTHVEPAHLYHDADELNQRVVFVGDGFSGTGETGPVDENRAYRAAQNTVDSVAEAWIVFTFDAPPAGDSLEGISGGGDSGGPALIARNDSVFVIGVSAYNDGFPVCTYGTREFYTRVSTEIAWLDGVMTGDVSPSSAPRLMRLDRDRHGHVTAEREDVQSVDLLPESDAALFDILEELDRAFRDGSADDFTALFSAHYLEAQKEKGDPIDGLFRFMTDVYDFRGPIHRVHPPSRQGVVIQESAYPMRPVTFHLKDGTSGYLGLALTPAGNIDHLSLFVMESVCPDGKDCRVARSLKDLRD